MPRLLLPAVLAACCAAAAAAEPAARPAKPLGTWARTVGDNVVTMRFEAEQLRVTLQTGGGATVKVDAAYGLTGDGLVFGTVTRVEKEGTDEGPSERDLFSFLITRDQDTLIVSELRGTNAGDQGKQLVQGRYKKVAVKKDAK